MLLLLFALLCGVGGQLAQVYTPLTVSQCWSGAAQCAGKVPTGAQSATVWKASGCPTMPECIVQPPLTSKSVQFSGVPTFPKASIADTRWLIGSNLVNTSTPAFRPGMDTLTGLQVTFNLQFGYLFNPEFARFPVAGIAILDPKSGVLVNHTIPYPQTPLVGSGQFTTQNWFTFCYPSSTNSRDCDRTDYLWEGSVFGQEFSLRNVNFSTTPFSNLGVALYFQDTSDGNPSNLGLQYIGVSGFQVTLSWLQGLVTPPATTVPPNLVNSSSTTTAGGSSSMLGAIIGGAVAGAIVLAAIIALIAYLAYRRKLQKPSIVLDSPSDAPYSSF